MSTLIIVMVWRVYLIGIVLLALNALARWLFKPSKREFISSLKALPFIAIWPLAIFSPSGRRVMIKRIEKL